MEVVERFLDSLGALWAEAADDRLAAYRSGEVKTIALSEVMARKQRRPSAIATLFVADCT